MVFVDDMNASELSNDSSISEDMDDILGYIGGGIFGNAYREGKSTDNVASNDNSTRLWEIAQQELYPRCTQHSKLSFTIRLLHIKSVSPLSKGSQHVVGLFMEMLLADNVVLRTFYEAK